MVTFSGNSHSSNVDSLKLIDTSSLSQSDLYHLSLSSIHQSLLQNDTVVVPKLDRNLFNESAGSRRQTYSRLRLAPRKPRSRRRLAGLLPSPKPPPSEAQSDPEQVENKLIIHYLKSLIEGEENPGALDLALVVSEERNYGSQSELAIVVSGGGSELGELAEKGKRGRKKRIVAAEGGGQRPLQILNRNGVAVDLGALASAADPYGDELRRRTAGLDREEEILEVLRGLDGQWCSRRKKRKIVDASGFGDALPIGWKLLLGLKRREGRVSVYCRRYIRYWVYPILHKPILEFLELYNI